MLQNSKLTKPSTFIEVQFTWLQYGCICFSQESGEKLYFSHDWICVVNYLGRYSRCESMVQGLTRSSVQLMVHTQALNRTKTIKT